MFDYPKWRTWLEARGVELRAEGLLGKFHAGPDGYPKPGMILELVGTHAMGGFENWITGETDYTVAKPPSPKGKMVAHKWGVIVSDKSFEPAFNEFLSAFRLANSN